MDEQQTTRRPPRTPTRRVNPAGDVVWVARWVDVHGKRHIGFRRFADPEVHIQGTYKTRGPCERDQVTCCAVHAIEACHEMEMRYGVSALRRDRPVPPLDPADLPEAGEWVYVVQANGSGLVKVGYSTAPASRLKQLQTSSADTLILVALLPGSLDLERRLHREMGDLHVRGEWFREGAVERVARIFRAGIGAWK